MAVYNGEDHVCEAVASVLAQSFEDFELIIADDASTDSTAAILAGFQDPRVRIVTNEENLGVTRTRNRLLEQARGEFIAVHDHDDISLPERLEKEVAFLRDAPDCVAVSCGYRLREPGRPERTAHPAEDDLAIRWHLLFGNALPHAGAMMRAAAMEAVGGYDERFTCCLDHDLFCRLSRIGRLRNLREPLVIVHKRREGISIGRRAEQQRFSKELNAREMSLLMGADITPDVAVGVEKVLAGRIFPLWEAGTVVRLALRLARSFREAHCCPKFISERLEWLLKEHVKFGGRCLLRGRLEEAAVRGCVAVELAASGLVSAPVRLLAGAALGCLRKPRHDATPDADAASAVPSVPVPPPAGPKPVVSVVIITRNRARLLEVALGSLAGQTAPARDFEVIVVDNGPHAATRRTADAFAVRMRVRCVAEPRTGRSYARNTGFALARADYVAYMDDDARAMPSWVAGIC
ncbi:MAG: glycosyltransferase family A protein, partial [Candidatus Brocadiia bacterium]|nr:glycosyltransferase family A protein [Candidatus Brocadiia bacterium]